MTADLTDPNGRKVKAKEDTVETKSRGRSTPGPWRILEKSRKMRSSIEIAHNHGKTFTIMAYPPEGSQHRVCVIDGPSNRDLLSQCVANARLIAAAPELLEACQSFEEYGDCTHVRDAIRAAIAKATE